MWGETEDYLKFSLNITSLLTCSNNWMLKKKKKQLPKPKLTKIFKNVSKRFSRWHSCTSVLKLLFCGIKDSNYNNVTECDLNRFGMSDFDCLPPGTAKWHFFIQKVKRKRNYVHIISE